MKKPLKSKRNVAIATTAGAIFGFVTGVVVRAKTPSSVQAVKDDIDLYMTPDQVTQLMDERSGRMHWSTTAGNVYVSIIDDSIYPLDGE